MTKAIWFISKYARLPSPDGYPARAFSLLRVLAEKGYDCTFFVSNIGLKAAEDDAWPRVEVREIEGVRVCRIKTLPYTKAKSVRRALSWLDFEWKLFLLPKSGFPKPDVVVASSLSLFSILNGLYFKWRYGSRLIFEVRDIWPLTITENGGFSRRNPLVNALALLEWLGYRYSDAVVGTMPNLRAHVRKILRRPRRVECIPMGIPRELLHGPALDPTPEVRAMIKKFGSGRVTVTYAGSIGIDNALDTFFEAAALMQSHDSFEFFVLGDGDLLPGYRRKFSHLKNLTFLDKIPGRQVQFVLRSSTVLYFAAHRTCVLEYGQSFNKVIDYMLAGRPILASFTGYRSMIDEAGCGDFVEAANPQAVKDKLLEYSQLPLGELDRMGQRGRAWVLENRQYDVLAEQYERVLFTNRVVTRAEAAV